MNIDLWQDEITVYEHDTVSVDDGEVLMLWPYGKETDNTFCLKINEDKYKLEEQFIEGTRSYIIVPKETTER